MPDAISILEDGGESEREQGSSRIHQMVKLRYQQYGKIDNSISQVPTTMPDANSIPQTDKVTMISLAYSLGWLKKQTLKSLLI